MTEVLTSNATEVATRFFDAYRDRDVIAMADMCTTNADFHYVPFEMWGKQRVLRGDGKVHSIGRVIWTGLVTAFPDLTNEVTSISADDNGNIVAELTVSGTQTLAWNVIGNKALHFTAQNLFVLHINGAGFIDSITTYWDNSSLFQQLGHLEID